MLRVAGENRVRGAMERVYALATPIPMDGNETDDFRRAMLTILLLFEEFERYLSGNGTDMMKDRLALRTGLFFLTDEEFDRFFHDLREVYARIPENGPGDNGRLRRATFVSSPTDTAARKGTKADNREETI